MPINFNYEILLRQKIGHRVIAGLDEVGRGPLAGPVTAGAFVFLEKVSKTQLPLLRDSKLLSAKQREELYTFFLYLKQDGCVDFASASVFPSTIDKKHIHHASVLAMRRAIKKLHPSPGFAVIDKFSYARKILHGVPYALVVKADNLVPSVAAASIVAKVRRDHTMMNYHKKYPQYRFDKHKGYGTALHYAMLKKYGVSPIHRESFRLR